MYDELYIEVPPHMVNYINRIIEGYEYLGVLTTICLLYTSPSPRDA